MAELQQDIEMTPRAQANPQNECTFCRHGFLSVLSHELRNPLSALSNSLYVLKNSQPNEPRAARAMAVMERQIARLASLIDNIGQAASIGRGRVELQRGRIDLSGFLHETIADHEGLFLGREIELRGDIPSGPIVVLADPIRLAQVLGILLHNAAQFTPRGGHVSLSLQAETSGQMALIQVRDSGIGLEPGLRERLFLPFSQGDTSLARSSGGLGLGLALAKGLVDLHGGSIRADSAGAGQGATFTVSLPLQSQSVQQVATSAP